MRGIVEVTGYSLSLADLNRLLLTHCHVRSNIIVPKTLFAITNTIQLQLLQNLTKRQQITISFKNA